MSDAGKIVVGLKNTEKPKASQAGPSPKQPGTENKGTGSTRNKQKSKFSLFQYLCTAVSIALIAWLFYKDVFLGNKGIFSSNMGLIITLLIGNIFGYKTIDYKLDDKHSVYKRRITGGIIMQIVMPLSALYNFKYGISPIFNNVWLTVNTEVLIFIIGAIIAYSLSMDHLLANFIALISSGIIIYTLHNYITQGVWNVLGVIIWSLLALIFGTGFGYMSYTDGMKISNKISGILAMIGIPGLGIINAIMYPFSFWPGWWIVFIIGAVMFFISIILGAANE